MLTGLPSQDRPGETPISIAGPCVELELSASEPGVEVKGLVADPVAADRVSSAIISA